MLIHMADQEELKAVIDRAGPIALLFVIALGVAVFVIARSLNRQLKKIDPQLPMGTDDKRQAADARYTEEAVERGEREAAERDEHGATEQGEDERPGG